MGRHDYAGHRLHPSKWIRFRAPKPPTATDTRTFSAPQNPRVGSNEKNQYR